MSEPIPEVNDQPVKTVVADSLREVVFNSGNNVLLEFYMPWCGHCQKLAPILDEVTVSLKDDEDVVAKMFYKRFSELESAMKYEKFEDIILSENESYYHFSI